MRPIRILLTEGHALVRDALRHFLAAQPGFEVVVETGDSARVLPLVAATQPDLLLLSPQLPGSDGIEMLGPLKAANPHLKVLMLSAERGLEAARCALAAGADGYALKHDDGETLVRAVHAVLTGEIYVSPRIDTALAENSRNEPPDVWALYRTGLAQSHRGEPRAEQTLRTAYARFVTEKDSRGAMLSAAALLIAGQLLGSYHGFPELLDRLQVMKQAAPPVRSPDEELLGLTALLLGQLLFDLEAPDVDRCVSRMMELMQIDVDVNLRLAAARMVLYYIEPRELRELGQRVNALVQTDLGHPALTPHRHAHWLITWRGNLGYAKQRQQEADVTLAVRELADRHGLRDIKFLLAFDELNEAMPSGDLARAERAFADAEALVDPARLRELMMLDACRSHLARMKGHADETLFFAARARKYAVELQCPRPMLASYMVNEAQARLQTQDFAGARGQMEEAILLVPEGFAKEIRENIDLIVAFEAMAVDVQTGLPLLAAVWARMRERQFYDSFDGYPEFGARLCALALDHDIEADFVRNLIGKRQLAAPESAGETWPWPLRIYALGQFALQRDGVAMTFDGKAQKKPLELLRALVAHGATRAGKGADVGELIDQLWPDLEASAPKASFDMTLMRLRKLLQVDGAVRLTEGSLWLDPSVVWCDTSAFEQDCDALQALLLRAPDNPAALHATAGRLRRHDADRLFGARSKEPWSAASRERLALKLTQAVIGYGAYLEAQADWQAALGVYEHGIAQDRFSEVFYRGLMRCHLRLGQNSAALRAFERCRDLLWTVLKVQPAAETLALQQQAVLQ